jgi:hypothetical protein
MAAAAPPPPAPPTPPYGQFPMSYPSPPPGPPKKSRTILYAVVAAIVVIVVVLAAILVLGSLGSSPSSSGTRIQSHQVNVVNTQNQKFGPAFTGAGVYSVAVPSGAIRAWVNGSFQVTGCTSIGNYCLANSMLVTPSEWSNIEAGAASSVVWCYGVGSTCQSAQNVAIASGDISSYAGQSLDLVFYSNATTESQTYSADATLTYLTSS